MNVLLERRDQEKTSDCERERERGGVWGTGCRPSLTGSLFLLKRTGCSASQRPHSLTGWDLLVSSLFLAVCVSWFSPTVFPTFWCRCCADTQTTGCSIRMGERTKPLFSLT